MIMRNATLFAIVMTFGFTSAVLMAQDPGSPIKVDAKASEASRQQQTSASAEAGEALNHASSASIKRPTLDALPEVLATWNGGELTREEVSSTLAHRRPAEFQHVSPHQFATLPRKSKEEVVKRLAWEQVLLQKAREAGISETTPEVAKAISSQDQALLNRIYYEKEIVPALNNLTEKVAREFYDKNLDERFTQPAQTVIRALHVSTYEMVTAEEGDTLTELATQISGSAEAAKRILHAVSPFYLRQTPAELDDKVLSSPLTAGEVVLVPLNEDAVSSATRLAERLREKLVDGRTIDELAAETKDEDFVVSATEPVRFSSAAGFWDELTRTANTMEGTSISEVVKTPMGLNILVIEDRTTTKVVDFDAVKGQLVEKVTTDEEQRRQTVEQTREEILDRLWKKYNVQVNRNAISRANYQGADALTTDTAIVQVDDFKYTLNDFLSDIRLTGKDWGQLTEAERMEVVKVAPAITNHVIAREARDLKLTNDPEYKQAIDGIIESEIVAEYRRRNLDPGNARVTDAELRSYYNDHLDKYTSAAQVTLREISKRINMTLPPATKAEEIEKAKASLSEIRSRITSEEDFAQLARRESQAISTRSRGGLIGTVNDDFRGEAFKNQLRQLKPGEISEPFLYGSEVMIVRLDDRTAPTVQPFEEVRRRIMVDYAQTEPAAQKSRAMNRSLDEAGFKIAF